MKQCYVGLKNQSKFIASMVARTSGKVIKNMGLIGLSSATVEMETKFINVSNTGLFHSFYDMGGIVSHRDGGLQANHSHDEGRGGGARDSRQISSALKNVPIYIMKFVYATLLDK